MEDVKKEIDAIARQMDQVTAIRSDIEKAVHRHHAPAILPEEPYKTPALGDFEERGTESQIAALYAALARARGNFGPIKKDRRVDVGKYKFDYAPMENLLAATVGPLSAEGIFIMMPFMTGRDQITKQLVIIAHASGGRIVYNFEFTPAEDEKIFGGQTTYLQRYCYRSVLMLAADADLDDVPTREGEQQRYAGPRDQQPQQARQQQPAQRQQPRRTPGGPAEERPFAGGPTQTTSAPTQTSTARSSEPTSTQTQATGSGITSVETSRDRHAVLLGEMLAAARAQGMSKRSELSTFIYSAVSNGEVFPLGEPFCVNLTPEQIEKCLTVLMDRAGGK